MFRPACCNAGHMDFCGISREGQSASVRCPTFALRYSRDTTYEWRASVADALSRRAEIADVARAGSKLEVQLSDPCLVRYDAPPGCPWPVPLDRRPNREPKS